MLSFAITGQVSEIPPAVDRVAAFLEGKGASEGAVFAFRLALEELMTNAATHGRIEGAAPPTLRVACTVAGDEAVCELTDDGRAFDPLSAPPPDIDAPLETREAGGLGVHLVREVIRDLSYRREGGLNVLRLARPLAEGPC